MFPEDENIKLASVELTVSVFEAVERGIDFFISNECWSSLLYTDALGYLLPCSLKIKQGCVYGWKLRAKASAKSEGYQG